MTSTDPEIAGSGDAAACGASRPWARLIRFDGRIGEHIDDSRVVIHPRSLIDRRDRLLGRGMRGIGTEDLELDIFG